MTSHTLTLAGGALGFNWLPVFVAREHGLFERRALQVELQRLGSVDKATQAVRSSSADLAITPPEGAIADALGGGPLRLVAGNVNRLPLTLIAQPGITDVRQLQGAVLGTSSLTEGTAIYTREMLAQHGLQYPSDYRFEVVGVHPERWKALQAGTISAALQLVPLNFVAVDAGFSALGEASDAIPEIVFTALLADRRWAAAHSAAVVELLGALAEATAILYDAAHDDALLPLVAQVTQCDERYARRALAYLRERQVFSRGLGIPPAALVRNAQAMAANGLLDPARAGDVATAFDDTWLRSAGLCTGERHDG